MGEEMLVSCSLGREQADKRLRDMEGKGDSREKTRVFERGTRDGFVWLQENARITVRMRF